jgi:hypothetical protein
MGRLSKSIILAFLGLLLTGANVSQTAGRKDSGERSESQRGSTNRKPATSHSPVSMEVEGPAPTKDDKLTIPCEKGHEQRQSDLCAQWKAADAADRAAWWAMVGTVVTLFGTSGLYWQIHLSRKAVRDTSLATIAMAKANEIAAASQRPWLSIHVEPKVLERQGRALRCEIDILVKNLGQSAAKNYCLLFDFSYTSDGNPNNVDDIWKDFEKKKQINRSLVIPGDVEVFEFWSYKNVDFIEGFAPSNDGNGGVLARFVVSAFYQSDVTGDQWLQIDKAW